MTYAKAVLIAIDQLGNALAGGNPDCTISGRIGYYKVNGGSPYVWYWNMLAFVVNLTFYPWDSFNHCTQAYEKERDEDHFCTKNPVALFLLSILTLGSCVVMMPIFWVIYGVTKFVKIVIGIKN